MDRYFYLIELHEDGKKYIHMSGNVYWNDTDTSETDYRYAEYVGLYMSLEDLKEAIDKGWLFEYLCEQVKYLEDLSYDQAIDTCERYCGGHPGEYMSIKDVNEETPCGEYWFDGNEINT